MSDITTTTYENVRPPVSETGANDSSITSKMARNDVTTIEPGEGTEHVLLKFECPSTMLNAKMRKILTRVHILNIELFRN
jgi:hypothetical protein